MNDIKGAIVYAGIMATFGTLKDVCNSHYCCIGCHLKDDNGICLLFHTPEKYDLDKLDKQLISFLQEITPLTSTSES